MTPEQADKIFRDWREEYFSWSSLPHSDMDLRRLRNYLGCWHDEMDSVKAEAAILGALEVGLISRLESPMVRVYRPPSRFADPPPLPPAQPIPFPAGAALLEALKKPTYTNCTALESEPEPLTFSALHKLAEDIKAELGLPETGRYWRFPNVVCDEHYPGWCQGCYACNAADRMRAAARLAADFFKRTPPK